MSKEYIVENLAKLTASDNMPATFQVEYADYCKECEIFYETHLTATAGAEEATQTKTLTNNNVYARLMDMLNDAHLAITDNPALLKQFTFSSVLALVDPSTSAGIKGTVISAATGLPIPNVSLTIVNPATSTTTDDEGKYDISQMATGSNTLIA
jgi:cytoskeletal protein RodZ